VTHAALLLAGSYLVGSISFSLVVVRLLRRVDLRTLGSGNAGATNVLRTSGSWPALAVLALDIGKGYIPVAIAKRLAFSPELVAGAGLVAVLGHIYPVFFGFRGGRGVATGFGALVALFPLAGAVALGIFVATVFATRYVSVGSIVAALSVPPLAWGFGAWGVAPPPAPGAVAVAALCVAVVVLRHASNLRRLTAGTERRLGERSGE